MKTWKDKFKEKHGERLFFMLIIFIMGALFLSLGIAMVYFKTLPELGQTLIGAGVTQWIAVATIANNKARSPEDKGKE